MQKKLFLIFFLVSFFTTHTFQTETERAEIALDAEILQKQLEAAERRFTIIARESEQIHSFKTYRDSEGRTQKAISGNDMSVDAVFMNKRITLKGILRNLFAVIKRYNYQADHKLPYTPLKKTLDKIPTLLEKCDTFEKEVQEQLEVERQEQKQRRRPLSRLALEVLDHLTQNYTS